MSPLLLRISRDLGLSSWKSSLIAIPGTEGSGKYASTFVGKCGSGMQLVYTSIPVWCIAHTHSFVMNCTHSFLCDELYTLSPVWCILHIHSCMLNYTHPLLCDEFYTLIPVCYVHIHSCVINYTLIPVWWIVHTHSCVMYCTHPLLYNVLYTPTPVWCIVHTHFFMMYCTHPLLYGALYTHIPVWCIGHTHSCMMYCTHPLMYDVLFTSTPIWCIVHTHSCMIYCICTLNGHIGKLVALHAAVARSVLGWGSTDLYYARGTQVVLLMRAGSATSQLDLLSLTPSSVACCGRQQLWVPHWAALVDYFK